MKIVVVKNDQEMSQKAYEKMVSVIENNPNCVLGLATGGTPEGTYELFRQNKPNTAHVTTVNLDEYIGVSKSSEASYDYYMKSVLFNHLPFKANYLPNGEAQNPEEECKRYEDVLNAHPVDLQLLGIGENGHIAFNEPGTAFDSLTQIVELTPSTREANSRYFDRVEDVPTHAITMGIGSILRAKELLLIASGEKKADAIRELVEGEISEQWTCTALRNHPNVTIIVDEAAYSKCKTPVTN
ncbi:MAG: glucosamine-6-phosphate deaminase [Bacilli bacterium]